MCRPHRTIAAVIVVVYILLLIDTSTGIVCYSCTSSTGCTDGGSSTCALGLFGCVKIATYSGGLDQFGNQLNYNDQSNMISVIKTCNYIPIGGVDACRQEIIVGFRIVTCYCFTDYCNRAPSASSLVVVVVVIVASLMHKIVNNT